MIYLTGGAERQSNVQASIVALQASVLEAMGFLTRAGGVTIMATVRPENARTAVVHLLQGLVSRVTTGLLNPRSVQVGTASTMGDLVESALTQMEDLQMAGHVGRTGIAKVASAGAPANQALHHSGVGLVVFGYWADMKVTVPCALVETDMFGPVSVPRHASAPDCS